MDPTRRKILKTGAAATVVAAAPGVFAQQAASSGTGTFYVRGQVRIHHAGRIRVRLSADADRRRRVELDDRRFRGTSSTRSENGDAAPLHRGQPVQVAPASGQSTGPLDRPALGLVYR